MMGAAKVAIATIANYLFHISKASMLYIAVKLR